MSLGVSSRTGTIYTHPNYDILLSCLQNMPRDKRHKRDLRALNVDGMLMCNPRDKEAALRAQTEEIATYDWKMVTCRKCLSLVYKHNKISRQKPKKS